MRHYTDRKSRLLNSLASSLLIGVFISALLCVSGCARAQKDAADAAITTSTAAFAAIRDEAVKYEPGQSSQVEKAIQSAKDSLANGNYARALAAAKDIPSQVQELSASIKDRKEELKEQWDELTETVPAMIRAAERHLQSLNRAHKTTAGPRDVLAVAQKQWQSANAAYAGDELLTAVAKGNSAKDTLTILEQDTLQHNPEKGP